MSNNPSDTDRDESCPDPCTAEEERIAALEAKVAYYEARAAECDSYADRLEAARAELQAALDDMYNSSRESEREFQQSAQEARDRGDQAAARRYEEREQAARRFADEVASVRDSFNNAYPQSWQDVAVFSAKAVGLANTARDVSPSLTHAAERLTETSVQLIAESVSIYPELAGIVANIKCDFDPINLSTGNFFYLKEDIKVPGRHPLEFKRFYNALGGLDGVLGLNWTHNYNIRLFDNGEQVHIVFDDGHVETYTQVDVGFYVAPMGHTKVLTVAADGGFVLTFQTMEQYTFGEGGALHCISDTNGNKTTLEYEGEGILLAKVITASGSLSFSYNDDGRMSSVSDHTGREVSFEYEQGQLSKVTQPNGAEFNYKYDVVGLMSSITNAQGVESVKNEYDEKGRTIVQHMADGGVAHLAYDDERMITTTTDQAGNKTDHYRDEKYRTVKISYGDCDEQFEYDDFDNRTKYIDKCKNVYRYEYDVYANMTAAIDPLGNTISMEYNNFNKIVKIIQPNEGIVSFTHDDYGNILSIVDPIGRETGLAYNDNGLVAAITMPDLSQSILEHDERGNIVAITDGVGAITRYEYNDLNRVIKTISPEGAVTLYEYNLRGDISKVTNAEGASRSYDYNISGKVIRFTDFDGSVIEYKYNSVGKVKEVIDQARGTTKLTYDKLWNVASVTDPIGATVNYEHNRFNKVIRTTDQEGNVTEYEHDNNGNVITVISPLKLKTHIKYDALNRPCEIAEANGAVTKLTYEKGGNIAGVTDALNNTTKREYDLAGQLIKLTDTLGNVTTLTYTALGKIESVTNAKNERISYSYYPGGLLKSVVLPCGESETYEHDLNGNVVRVTDALGNATNLVYDSLDRVIEVINPLKHSRKFAYDAVNNITQVTDENGNITQYKHSALGDVVEVIDAAGNSTKYSYDAMRRMTCLQLIGDQVQVTTYKRNKKGEVIEVISPLGDVVKYGYGQVGNITSKLDEDNLETLYDYNLANKLAKVTYADGKTVEFEYNALKQLTEMRDWLGVTKIEPDALGRVIKVTDPDGNEVGYTWNSLSQREKLTYPDGSEVSYDYDASGKLAQVIAGSDITKYTHDLAGRIAERILPDGTVTKYEFNAMNLLASLTHIKGGDILDQFKYTHDPVGNIVQIDKYRAGIEIDNGSFKYGYDPLNRLVEAINGHNSKQYGHDNIGNRISSIHNGIQADHGFNARNQLIKTTTGDDITDYGYDKRGNLTDVTENGVLTANYIFDATNMLSAATTGNGTAEYGYNGLRKRISKQENLHSQTIVLDPCREVRYVLDLTRPYDDLLATNNQGTISQNFIWGNGLLSASSSDNAVSNSFHYLHDHLGSPIRLLGANNNDEAMAYDEFGVPEVTANAQGFNSPFGFTGYQIDKISELYYAQARYYSPANGRFFAEDPIKDRFNWYGYCNANPVGFIDPTGLADETFANVATRTHVGYSGGFATAVNFPVAGTAPDITPMARVTPAIQETPFAVIHNAAIDAGANMVSRAYTASIAMAYMSYHVAMYGIDIRNIPSAVSNSIVLEATLGLGYGGSVQKGTAQIGGEATLVTVTASTNPDQPPLRLEGPNATGSVGNNRVGLVATFDPKYGLDAYVKLPGDIAIKNDNIFRISSSWYNKVGGAFLFELDPVVFFRELFGITNSNY